MISEIEKLLGEKIVSSSSLSGGCIANSQVIVTKKKKKYFIKSHENKKISTQKEANGLRELAKAKTIRIPKIIANTDNFLLLEFIKPGREKKDFFELFGRQFAQLHKTNSDKFGFYEDNYIGSNEQINFPKTNSWIEFFWNNRLLFQFKLAEKNGYLNAEFINLINKLESKLPSIINEKNVLPALLHGDLWNCNFIIDEIGNPVLIDPAVYYGNREADIAMTLMFGGFNPRFYSSYNEENPLEEEWEYRVDLYMLYHVLNHLNLFGRGYYPQAISIIKKYV